MYKSYLMTSWYGVYVWFEQFTWRIKYVNQTKVDEKDLIESSYLFNLLITPK